MSPKVKLAAGVDGMNENPVDFAGPVVVDIGAPKIFVPPGVAGKLNALDVGPVVDAVPSWLEGFDALAAPNSVFD